MVLNQGLPAGTVQEGAYVEQINLMAKEDLTRLLTESGHTLTLSDVPLLLELQRLAERVSNKTESHNKACSLYPVRLGPMLLHAPTLAGMMWYDNHAHLWVTDSVQIAATIFILSNQSKTFCDIPEDEILLKVLNFSKAIDSTIEECVEAISCFLDVCKSSGESKKTTTQIYGSMISFLCREYGSTPTYWLHTAPFGEISMMLADFAERKDAEFAAWCKSAKKKVTVNNGDFHAKIKAYRDHVNLIRKEWGANVF